MFHKSKSWLIKYKYLQGLQLRALRHNLRSHDIFDARKSGVGWCPKRKDFLSLSKVKKSVFWLLRDGKGYGKKASS